MSESRGPFNKIELTCYLRIGSLKFLSLAILVSVLPFSVSAQETEQQRIERVLQSYQKTTIQIPSIQGTIKIDGNLQESAWAQAAVVDIAWQISPAGGLPAKVKTTAFIMEDGKQLYVGFKAEDPDPSAIRAFLRKRDTFFADDYVGFSIDTTGDGTRAFEFFSNALGVQGDAVVDLHRGEDFSYDAIFETAGQITGEGFEVEFAIPLNQLRFPKRTGKQQWKLAFFRTFSRDRRYQSFQYPVDKENACFICQYQPAEGLIGATPGKRFQIVPTITANTRSMEDPQVSGSGQRDTDYDLGIDDFRWGIGSDLMLNATLNPDFSQIEVDVAQSSVNRNFALFFPERRPFFLEGRDFFSTQLNLVNTRNIADPVYGAKVTGKVGANVYGVLTAQDRVTNVIIAGSQGSTVRTLDQKHQSSTVRYRRDFSDSSFAGVLFTDRRGDDYANQVISLDGRYRVTNSDSLDLQLVHSRSKNPADLVNEFAIEREYQDNGYRISYKHTSHTWSWGATRDYFGKNFRADAGFINQSDVQRNNVDVFYSRAGQPGAFFSRVNIGGFAGDAKTVSTNDFLNRAAGMFIGFAMPRDTFIGFNLIRQKQSYDNESFAQWVTNINLRSRSFRGFSYFSSIQFGDQIDFANTRQGEFVRVRQNLSYNIGRHLLLRLGHTYHNLTIDGDDLFTVNLTDLRLTYQFNLQSDLNLTLIRNDVSREPELYGFDIDAESQRFDAQLLYSYQLNPQSVFFAGYSTSGINNDELDRIEKTADTVFVKLSYAWRL
ncbi:MAG: DUF5916 domain-containing protein [Gammaproteobacteria bacterium]|nr:DUF5916 domain-containing protein [Gammaproteobacteria bacterium]